MKLMLKVALTAAINFMLYIHIKVESSLSHNYVISYLQSFYNNCHC